MWRQVSSKTGPSHRTMWGVVGKQTAGSAWRGRLALGSKATSSPALVPAAGQWPATPQGCHTREKEVNPAGLCPICDPVLRTSEQVLTSQIPPTQKTWDPRAIPETFKSGSFSKAQLLSTEEREQLGELSPGTEVYNPKRAAWLPHRSQADTTSTNYKTVFLTRRV